MADVESKINPIYIYIPGTQMTSIFEGQPPKTRPFPIKTRVIWVPGIYTTLAGILSPFKSSSNRVPGVIFYSPGPGGVFLFFAADSWGKFT